MITKFSNEKLKGFIRYSFTELQLEVSQNYRFVSVRDTPRVLTAEIFTSPSNFKKFKKLNVEFSMAMGLPRGKVVRFSRGRGSTIVIEIPKPKELIFSFDSTILPNIVGDSISIGYNLYHEPIVIDFNEPLQAHLLIAGATGSGKTILQQTVATQVAKIDSSKGFVLDVEKKGVAWDSFTDSTFLGLPVAIEEEQALGVLESFLGELHYRQVHKMTSETAPRYFLIVDELSSLLESEFRDFFVSGLKKISQVGREYGMHSIINTQYPVKSSLGSSEAKRQYGVRLVGKFDDGVAAKTAAGLPDSGAQYLSGPGDFLIVKEGTVERFQAALPVFKGLKKGKSGIVNRRMTAEVNQKELGRPKDNLEVEILLQSSIAILNRGIPKSFSTFGTRFSPRIGNGKAERYYNETLKLFRGLDKAGYKVVKYK